MSLIVNGPVDPRQPPWRIQAVNDKKFQEFLKEFLSWLITRHPADLVSLTDTMQVRDTLFDKNLLGTQYVSLDVSVMYSIFNSMRDGEAKSTITGGLSNTSPRTWAVALFVTEWLEHAEC